MESTTLIESTSDSSAIFFGLMGAASAMILSSIGAAYGSYKPNIFHYQSSSSSSDDKQLPQWENGIQSDSFNSQSKFKLSTFTLFIPIIIAGVLGIYGLIYSVIVLSSISAPDYSTARGYAHFFGGLTLGLSCLASGVAVGIVGRDGIRSLSENKSSAVKLILNLIYCEALGLYGLIFALIAASTF